MKSHWFTKLFIVRECGWNVMQELRKGSKIPVLIFGGNDDNIVPIELTIKIFEELKDENKLNSIKVFENAGHFLPFIRYHEGVISREIRYFFQNIS